MIKEGLEDLLMKINAIIKLVHVAYSAVRTFLDTFCTVYLAEAHLAAITASSLHSYEATSLAHTELRMCSSEDPLSD